MGKDSIQQSLKLLGEATEILELRKVHTNSFEDIALINLQYGRINDLQMQLHLQLFEQENEIASLSELISLKESSVYNGIRLQMNLRDVKFRDLPDSILLREKQMRSRLKMVTEGEGNDMEAFFRANTDWAVFLDELKKSYPRYYEMRYARLQEPVDRLKERVPKSTTLVRYFFVQDRAIRLGRQFRTDRPDSVAPYHCRFERVVTELYLPERSRSTGTFIPGLQASLEAVGTFDSDKGSRDFPRS